MKLAGGFGHALGSDVYRSRVDFDAGSARGLMTGPRVIDEFVRIRGNRVTQSRYVRESLFPRTGAVSE